MQWYSIVNMEKEKVFLLNFEISFILENEKNIRTENNNNNKNRLTFRLFRWQMVLSTTETSFCNIEIVSHTVFFHFVLSRSCHMKNLWIIWFSIRRLIFVSWFQYVFGLELLRGKKFLHFIWQVSFYWKHFSFSLMLFSSITTNCYGKSLFLIFIINFCLSFSQHVTHNVLSVNSIIKWIEK